MRKPVLLLLLLFSILNCAAAKAQSICFNASKASTLYCTPILAVENFRENVEPPGVPAGFSALNAALGTQLTQVPAPSPASGFLFSFGPSGLTRERDLGPIFSERPATVGRHKLYLEFTYQYFSFDQIDDVHLNQIPLQIQACTPGTGTSPPCGDPLQTNSRLDLKVHQFTAYVTFGLTSRIDVSAAIPILDVRLGMQSRCSICVQQQNDSPDALGFVPNSAFGAASGIGDVTFRVKVNVMKWERAGLAIGADVRAPTGDELNFLGSGAFGVRPFAAFGYYRSRVSPHANIGYQINGDSILASTDAKTPRQLPNSFTYAAGADVRILSRLSVTGDLLGQTFFSADRVIEGTRPDGRPDIERQTANFNTDSFAVGAKVNPVGNLLITGDVLFKLDNNGLHYRPTPLIGLSYTF